MVITVTLNPAVDKTVYIDNFVTGRVNRISKERLDIGGKGINVSKVLKNFGIESICTGFLGGMWEEYFCSELDRMAIKHKFVRIAGNIRTNVKIIDRHSGLCTDINEPGPQIGKASLEEFISNFESLCSEGDIIVLSGGAPPSLPENIYGVLTRLARSRGAQVIVDGDGPLLREAVKEAPCVIKPNDEELKRLLGIKMDSIQETVEGTRMLRRYGVKKILVSLGAKGALYITDSGVFYCNSVEVPVLSTVGAGDSMVAALIYSHYNNFSDKETLRFAVACGAATVALDGSQPCSLTEVQRLLKKVNTA